MRSNGFKKFGGSRIPSTECLHHERFEDDAGSEAIVGMFSHFLSFAVFDGRSCDIGGPVDDGVLSWRYDADIESSASTVDPAFHEDVGGTRLRSRYESRHFLLRVKPSALSFLENLVPNPVVPSPTDPMVVTAVHSVVAFLVQGSVAVIRCARGRRHSFKTEAVRKCLAEGARIEVQLKSGRGQDVKPISGVRKREGKEPSAISLFDVILKEGE